MEMPVKRDISLDEMAANLRAVGDGTWGRYAFSRDFLRDRVPDERKEEMIRNSVRCGGEYADRIARETGESAPRAIARRLGLSVLSGDLPMAGKRVLFAQFTPPDRIEIMREPIEKYRAVLLKMDGEETGRLPGEREVSDVLLGHEIFHFLEDRDEDKIYTRTEKITLWRFLNFRNESTVEALGEIAAMAFTKKLNRLVYSPFLLDVLLFFGYNPEGARSIYRNVMDRKERETEQETGGKNGTGRYAQ